MARQFAPYCSPVTACVNAATAHPLKAVMTQGCAIGEQTPCQYGSIFPLLAAGPALAPIDDADGARTWGSAGLAAPANLYLPDSR